MQRLTVLYDDRCGLCRWAKTWARSQRTLVTLEFVAAGSDEARRRFPSLASAGPPEELVAVSDEGHVYRNDSAWILCLYALEDYREWSVRLADPLLRPLARQAFALVSRGRLGISRWLGLTETEGVAARLRTVEIPPCRLPGPSPHPERG